MSRQAAAKIEQPETPSVRKIDPEISEVLHLIGAMERLAGEMSAARGADPDKDSAEQPAAATPSETDGTPDTD